ncbi:hypothetical protein HYH03_016096 [Edaphochlamys debaryana]|uniref:Uncharacterized protein n=1 Tax=Edaphochlamys debaryana TaxID=47281 RepID=A0A835XLQ7_9CHLO|nr:hypothetical protein HYH03_016096 [Edaphochlamys debaryana]|eukprot:KAG2485108.1 hypothetical protein HYH03_016096 [Edaphochlamys debaryana]
MARAATHLAVALLLASLAQTAWAACTPIQIGAQNATFFRNNTASIRNAKAADVGVWINLEQELQQCLRVYPPPNIASTDVCPDSFWQSWSLLHPAPEYHPYTWTNEEWQDYLRDYPLKVASFSIVWFILAIIGLAAVLIWRLVQWCVGCSASGCGGRCQSRACARCCGVGSETTSFLGDTKHGFYLKFWILILIAGSISMVIWGMLALDAQLLNLFWNTVKDILQQGNDLSSSLEGIKLNINTSVMGNVTQLRQVAVTLFSSEAVDEFVQKGVGFVISNRTEVEALLANTTALTAGLNATLTGAALLLAEGGSRRLLKASPNSNVSASAASASATALLDRLDERMGALRLLPATAPAVLAALQDLNASLSAVAGSGPSDPTAPSQEAVRALAAALGAPALAPAALQGAVQALQDLEAVRSGALQAAVDAARLVASGAGSGQTLTASPPPPPLPLSTGSGQTLTAWLASNIPRISSALSGGALTALQRVVGGLVTSTGASNSSLLYQAAQLVDEMEQYLALQTNGSTSGSGSGSGHHRRRARELQAADFNLSAFLGSLLSTSDVLQLLGDTADTYMGTVANVSTTAASGPATDTAITGLNSTLAAVLVLQPAVTSYENGTTSDVSTFRKAVYGGTAAVSAAIPAVNATAADAAALAALAASVNASVALVPYINTTYLGNVYDNLAQMNVSISSYASGVSNYLQLGYSAFKNETLQQISARVAEASAEVVNSINDAADTVSGAATDATGALNQTIAKLNDDILATGQNFVDDWEDDSQQVTNVAYGIWMGVWGLAALLLLILAAAVLLNWPAGFVATMLGLLALCAVSMGLSSAFAFGIGVLDDACNGLESATLAELVDDNSKWQIYPVASYFLYNFPTEDQAIFAATNVDPQFVRQLLGRMNDSLTELKNTTVLDGSVASLASALQALAASTLDSFNMALAEVSYSQINPLYVSAKSLACCDAGDFAVRQWCAMTAAASLAFGACMFAAYLLARMDLLPRDACCSCCGCALRRPPRKADPEAAALDKTADAANAKLREQRDEMEAAAAAAAAAKSMAKKHGIAPTAAAAAQPAGPAVAEAEVLPTGFMTAAGGAAAAAAISGGGAAGGAYAAPSGPTMTKA